MYEEVGVPRSRILVKIAATWEGIVAAKTLEEEGISCNLTLIFSHVQGVACAQADATLISPFPGRVLDWHNDRRDSIPSSPEDDEGVQVVKKMHHYFRKFGLRKTILMPASWRPSRGTSNSDFALDEIRALAGVDRMTIPAPLLEALQASSDPLPRLLEDDTCDPELAGRQLGVGEDLMDEKTFRYLLNLDGCGTDKLGEGLRSFITLTEQLEEVIEKKVEEVRMKEIQIVWRNALILFTRCRRSWRRYRNETTKVSAGPVT